VVRYSTLSCRSSDIPALGMFGSVRLRHVCLLVDFQGLGLRVLGTIDWGNPADCGMYHPLCSSSNKLDFKKKKIYGQILAYKTDMLTCYMNFVQITKSTNISSKQHTGIKASFMTPMSEWMNEVVGERTGFSVLFF
jgi:hypothetical protein